MLLFPAAGEDDHDPAQDDQPYRCLTGVKSHSEEVDEQSCGQYAVEYMSHGCGCVSCFFEPNSNFFGSVFLSNL